MQENGDFFAIFSLEDARVASYSLRAPHNATSVIGDPAEHYTSGGEARIFARPLAKAKQVAERDINNTNNINQQLIARKTTHCALEGFTCGRNRKARLVAGNNVSECDSRGREKDHRYNTREV